MRRRPLSTARIAVRCVATTCALALLAPAGTVAASAGAVGDPGSTRRAYALAALMALVGLAIAAVTVWFWRSTRPEPRALAPLEVMGTRTWRQGDPIARLDRLDAVRPEGADALGRRRGRVSALPGVELDGRAREIPIGFDDLTADGSGEIPAATHAGAGNVPDLEQLLASLGIDPSPFVHRANGEATPFDETRERDRPEPLDPLLRRSDDRAS